MNQITNSAAASLGIGYGQLQMSMIGFRAQATDFGTHSGWYRLQLYQLQEEALKKDEQKQGQEAPQRAVEVAQAKPVAAPATKPKRAPRKRIAGPAITERILQPFVFRSIVPAPTVYDKLGQILKLPSVTEHIKIASAKIINLHEERQKRRRHRRRVAALFLLAA